jgi:hypothetical protein
MIRLIGLWVLTLGTIDIKFILADGTGVHLKSWIYWLMGRYNCHHRISLLQIRNGENEVEVPCIKCGAILRSNPTWNGLPVLPADVELTPHGIISGTVEHPRVKGTDMGICVRCGIATDNQSIIGGRWRYYCDDCCYGVLVQKVARAKKTCSCGPTDGCSDCGSVRLPQSVERDALNGRNSNGAHDTGTVSPAESQVNSPQTTEGSKQ